MRVLLVALGVLAFAPASAAAQDVSVTGAASPASAPNERTVRLTVTNHGPGAFAAVRLAVAVDPAVAYLRLVSGCNMPQGDYANATCFAFPNPGESQSFDLIAGFRATRDFHRDQVTAALTFTDMNGQPVADANPANDTATVDMGIAAPPASLGLQAVVPGILTHREPATFTYVVSNTGGQDLTDIRVSDDRCTGPQRIDAGSTDLRAGVFGLFLGITCVYTPPPHRRGEPRRVTTTVTATARTSAGELVTASSAHRSLLAEPRRDCGRLSVRLKGKRTRWKTRSTVADRSCKTVRRQLRACMKRGRAPAGFRCHQGRTLVRMWRPGASVPTDMQATKA
jgi:hypothetical protein